MEFAIQLLEKNLLREDRTFQQALQVAIANEVAAKETMQVQQQQLSQPVNSVTKDPLTLSSSSRDNSRIRPSARQVLRQTSTSSQQAASYACFSCGNTDHLRSKCKFRNAVCRNCNTRGHISRVCKKGGVNAMCICAMLSDEDELFVVYDVNAMVRTEISVPLKIENNDCHMQFFFCNSIIFIVLPH